MGSRRANEDREGFRRGLYLGMLLVSGDPRLVEIGRRILETRNVEVTDERSTVK
jgi:hypothetical protein